MIRGEAGKKAEVKWNPGGGEEIVRGKEVGEKKKKTRLAKSPPGRITESKPQQQTIKTQQYLPLKCPFLRQDRSFNFISMQMGQLTCTRTNPHALMQKKIMLTHACTVRHMHTQTHIDTHAFPNMPQSATQKWQQTGK